MPTAAKWVYFTCPVCGKQTPYSEPRYRYLVSIGETPQTCSRKCSAVMRTNEWKARNGNSTKPKVGDNA